MVVTKSFIHNVGIKKQSNKEPIQTNFIKYKGGKSHIKYKYNLLFLIRHVHKNK